jgi:hypothetical protein
VAAVDVFVSVMVKFPPLLAMASSAAWSPEIKENSAACEKTGMESITATARILFILLTSPPLVEYAGAVDSLSPNGIRVVTNRNNYAVM